MRIVFITYFVFCLGAVSFAQQIPQYSQWLFHQFAMNPAHAGIKKCIDIHGVFRAQWVGIKGAPLSGFTTASIPLNSKRKKFLSARHGMGIKFEADKIGQFNTNRFNLAYAGHFNFNKDNRLSLGLYAGIVQFGYNHSTSTTVTPDPAVMRETSIIRPDAHFGAWWNGKNYYIGLMANQLIPTKWNIGEDSRFRFHFALNGGYRFIINDNLGLITSSMVRFPVIGPVNADININFDIQNIVNLGVGFRTQDAVIFMAGFKINQQFSLNYSFDLTVSGLRKASSGTHEIGISFLTCKPENRSTSRCPLFE
ncbi:MAG: type IX secretion system membrane protein PorP/SprF [Crocinitomicaceae bacterium]|nr:type IX secretion system membrane protein PorP/SprF [Crocinitomicaceae bacterium]